MITTKNQLPIDSLLDKIVNLIQNSNSLIIQAAPGAGKTTRVPQALLNIFKQQIIVLEPRRIAARLSAMRVSEELGEPCGNTVGYQIRFTKLENEHTKIKYITEGLFTRLVFADLYLKNISCVVIDEFHERHLHTDIALMLVKLLQKTLRPDLKLIIMSATLDVTELKKYLPEASTIVSEGKNYPVTINFSTAEECNKPLPFQVLNAVNKLLNHQECPGDILVFLPGLFEIKRCAETLKEHVSNSQIEIFTLNADTPISEQEKIFSKLNKKKIILATNVAETSVTIDGITGVIDSGLARIAGHANWSGLPTLDVQKISQASCIQRAGRAGRTQAGIAIRLFSEYDYTMRPQFHKPEIQRTDIAQQILELKILELKFKEHYNFSSYEKDNFFPWFDPPPPNNIQSSVLLLKRLKALDDEENITEIGKKIAQYPLHTRLGCLLVTGKQKNLLPQTIAVVSLINERMILKKGAEAPDIGHSDIEFQLNLLNKIYNKEKLSENIKNKIDFSAVKRVEAIINYLCSMFKVSFHLCYQKIDHESLSLILLSGYCDRVAQFRKQSSKNTLNKKELNLCLGGGALLSSSSVTHNTEFLLAIDAEESSLALSQAEASQIRICHGIEPEILIAAPDEFLSQTEEYSWDSANQRVRGYNKTLYGKLVLEEQPIKKYNSHFEDLLKKQLTTQWPKPFDNDDDLQFLKNRIHLAEQLGYNLTIKQFTDDDFKTLIEFICENKKSFAEILEKDLQQYLDDFLNEDDKKILSELFPSYIKIGKGRKVKVHYETNKTPWIASRLQDFFGTVETPKIGKGTIPVVVHLLAPNMQAIQVTQDLKGFWERAYFDVKKELSRKYPRHLWPDNPKTAEPPELHHKKQKKI
ncbi:ATP-dependent helicase HrpB [Spirobacillus cienkowskii]|uniref:ATP-dependent helicase HrpB n=1 Tax=Spirobacillus cienkowskii TaxID=495820 RepID=UPI0030D59204